MREVKSRARLVTNRFAQQRDVADHRADLTGGGPRPETECGSDKTIRRLSTLSESRIFTVFNERQIKRARRDQRTAKERRVGDRVAVITEGNGACGGKLRHWRERATSTSKGCGGNRHEGHTTRCRSTRQLPKESRVIGSWLTVGHQRNSTVSAMRGGRLTAHYILRRARPWLTEVRMKVNERWEDETLRIFRPWFSPLNERAARLNDSIAPLQSRHLPAMHFNRRNASAPAHRVNNPVVFQ